MRASAASSSAGATFQADLRFPNNPPVSFILVANVPAGAATLAFSNAIFQGIIDTDGSGKIEGSGFERIVYGTFAIVIDTNVIPNTTNTLIIPTAYSDYNVTVSGKASTKNTLPSVQESLKGTGYSASRTNIVLDGSDGSIVVIQSPAASSSSFNVNFTGNNALVVISNSPSDTTFHLLGNLKGTIRPGIKAINNGNTIQVNEDADLLVDRQVLTNFNFQLVKFGNKFWANVIGANINGSGNVSSSGKITLNLKGYGFSTGSNLKLTGQKGDAIIIIAGLSTNAVSFISSADITGKIAGQTISVKDVRAVPVSFP